MNNLLRRDIRKIVSEEMSFAVARFIPKPPAPYCDAFGIGRLRKLCAAYFDVTELDIISARRDASCVKARHTLFWLARKTTLKSISEIGRAIGGRDHTTVMHGIKKIEDWRSRYPEWKRITDELLAQAGRTNGNA